MIFRNWILLLSMFTVAAVGQVPENQRQYMAPFRDYLSNPGAEQGLAGWAVTAGTLTRGTATKRNGSAALSFNPSASTQALSNTLVAIPAGNGSCLAEFFYYGAGTADYRIYIKDNSANVIGGYTAADTSWAITNAVTVWSRVQVPFVCPASGTTVQLVIEAQGDAAAILIDDAYIGRDFRVGTDMGGEVTLAATRITTNQTIASASATVVIFNSATTDKYAELNTTTGVFTAKKAGVVSVEVGILFGSHIVERNIVSIEKNGTIICSGGQGIDGASEGVNPSCSFSIAVGDTIQVSADSVSDTSYDVVLGAGAYFIITRYPSVSQTVLRGDVSDLTGALTYAGTASCSWSTTSASMAVFSADTDCPTATLVGNAALPATKVPGFIVPNMVPGKYRIEAQAAFVANESSSGAETCGFEIFDGTTTGSKVFVQQLVSKGSDSVSIVAAEFTYTTKKTNTQFEVRSGRAAGNAACSIDANNATFSDFQIRIVPLSQGLPRAFIPSSVFAGRLAVSKIGTANLNCDAGSSTTTDDDDMISGNPGNVSSGKCVVTLTTGYFSATPICIAADNNTASTGVDVNAACTSATACSIDCADLGAVACTAYDANLICFGNN